MKKTNKNTIAKPKEMMNKIMGEAFKKPNNFTPAIMAMQSKNTSKLIFIVNLFIINTIRLVIKRVEHNSSHTVKTSKPLIKINI